MARVRVIPGRCREDLEGILDSGLLEMILPSLALAVSGARIEAHAVVIEGIGRVTAMGEGAMRVVGIERVDPRLAKRVVGHGIWDPLGGASQWTDGREVGSEQKKA